MDKGPVIYEAYYPDSSQDSSQEKRYSDRNVVLETSFQVPSDRFAYSKETANRPAWNHGRAPPTEQRTAIGTRNYNSTNEFVPFHDDGRSAAILNADKSTRDVNIKEISKLVRRAISRDLDSWNALERYLERASNQAEPISQPDAYLETNREGPKENHNYPPQVARRTFDPSRQSSSKLPRKLETRVVGQLQPNYLEQVDASENTMKDKIIVNGMQAVDAPSINVIPDSLAGEDIFQPRPQMITYTFIRKLTPRLNEQIGRVSDESMPHDHGSNLMREGTITADNSGDERIKEDVKIASIEVSELPRHKVRHHHDERPKRRYPGHSRRSQSAAAGPDNKEK